MIIEIAVEFPCFGTRMPRNGVVRLVVKSEELALRIADHARSCPSEIACIGNDYFPNGTPVRLKQLRDEAGLGQVIIREGTVGNTSGWCRVGHFEATAAIDWPS